MDTITTVETLKKKVEDFVQERDWQQYHSLKNLSMDIAIEAAELMELFVWVDGKDSTQILETKNQEVQEEVADIAFALLNFCNRAGIDLSQAMQQKMALNAQKYPLSKSKGKSSKYTEF